ncbi:hypothetical protein O9G_000252 [Rozella allomycis CSF55]|uniref:SH3 domain-containing protein n=1 Tax=Rozella allomycis (strain CSF55) TaxID=988480 RepID=A0A075AP71_ROZAC|nr:hypothetical protein O9G_000252 [Rozella allomycis CSF55]|eukprot:EPZ31773.1 hypothetical protein O9G_000252 [Rozella allomycis CSF55]
MTKEENEEFNTLCDKAYVIEKYFTDSIEMMNQMADYSKKRIAVENEYSKSIMKLNKNFSNMILKKKKGIDIKEFSPTMKIWMKFLDDCEEKSKFVTEMTSLLDHDVCTTLKSFIKSTDKDMKKWFSEYKTNYEELRYEYEAYERHKRIQDSTCRIAEEAKIAYEKADGDLNATKAQVSQLKKALNLKTVHAHEALEDLETSFEKMSLTEKQYYHETLPNSLRELQKMEEERLSEFMRIFKGFLARLQTNANRDKEVLESLNSQISNLDNRSQINHFVNANKSNPSSKIPDISTSNVPPVLQATVIRRKEKTRNANSVLINTIPQIPLNDEDIYNSPEEKRSKRATKRIHQIEEETRMILKKIEGVKKLLSAYSLQPTFSDRQTKHETESELQDLENKKKELIRRKNGILDFLNDVNTTKPVRSNSGRGSITVEKVSIIASFSDDISETLSNHDTPIDDPPINEEDNFISRAIVTDDFEGSAELNEISLKAGETINIISKDEGGWWTASKLRPNGGTQKGYVPSTYLQEIVI